MLISVQYVAPGLFKSPLPIELPEGSDILNLVQRLIQTWTMPELFLDYDGRLFAIFVVNGKKVTEDYVFTAGDEVVIIPPIGGG